MNEGNIRGAVDSEMTIVKWASSGRRVKRAIGRVAAAVPMLQTVLGARARLRWARAVRRDDLTWKADEDGLRARLVQRCCERRALRGGDGRPVVCAFGFNQWERNGLWPSFSEVSDFTLYEYEDLARAAGVNGVSKDTRRALEEECVRRIDELDRRGRRVSLAFFYVDTEFAGPGLFRSLAARGIWTVLMGLDDKKRLFARRERGMHLGQLTVARDADVLWTTWRLAPALVAEAGGAAWYAPEGADPKFHRPLESPRDIDVLFIGQRYGNRAAFVQGLRRFGFRVGAFGEGWPSGRVSFEQSIELISRAKVVLGVGDVVGMPGIQHIKGRDFEVPMCGAVYLTSYNPELAEWFAIGREILCYSTFENCVETLDWVLADETAQQRIREAGLRRARSEHRWVQRLEGLFGLFPAGR